MGQDWFLWRNAPVASMAMNAAVLVLLAKVASRASRILHERLDQAGGTLSGGEQQMLAIARALCGHPAVLLLDEPSEGIQPSIVQDLGRIIARISESSGTSVLLVEQNIDLALETSGRCLVMEKGRIVHEGAPDDLRDEAVLSKYLAI